MPKTRKAAEKPASLVQASGKGRTFESLRKLVEIVREEKSGFQIQIFSLEAVEVFEEALANEQIPYKKQFTSTYKPSRSIVLLLKDSDLPPIPEESRLLLYSTARDPRFVPYKFQLTQQEKEDIVGDRSLTEPCKRASLTSIVCPRTDVHSYTASALGYVQCIIVFCMMRENRFSRLFEEIKSVDSSLDNRFVIRCELNALARMGICRKRWNVYSIGVSNLTLQMICEKAGFGGAFSF